MLPPDTESQCFKSKGALARPSALDLEAWLAAAELIKSSAGFPETGALGPWFGTVGDPKLRLWPRDVKLFSPNQVLRRWRTAMQKLRKSHPGIVGFCVVELQLCRSLDRPGPGLPRYFFEPHLHFVLYGAPEANVKAAFRIRKNPHITVRKRPVKVQSVYDLDGAIGYQTKSRPDFRRQYRTADGKTGWGRSRFPARHLCKWHSVLSRYRVSDLLSSTGFSLRNLG